MNFYKMLCKNTGVLLFDVVEFEDNGVVVIYCPERKDIGTYDNIAKLKYVISKDPVILIKLNVF